MVFRLVAGGVAGSLFSGEPIVILFPVTAARPCVYDRAGQPL